MANQGAASAKNGISAYLLVLGLVLVYLAIKLLFPFPAEADGTNPVYLFGSGPPVHIKSDMLHLWLGCVGGALGSYVAMLVAFVDEVYVVKSDPRPAWSYILAPVMGMATAVLVYLLAWLVSFVLFPIDATKPPNSYGVATLGLVTGFCAQPAVDKLKKWIDRLFA